MKHLGNCKPDEFMAAVVKFRPLFKSWCEQVGAAEISARRPEGYDEKDADAALNAEISISNIGEIVMASFTKAPELTKEILCMATFTEPERFNDNDMMDYITAAMEMYANKGLRSFFTCVCTPMPKISAKD